ncbi:MAG: hypothetical protein AAF799_23925 [Myxococcota bacterium]
MIGQGTGKRCVGALVGVLVGMAVAMGCAGKKKGTQTPEQCMNSCEQETCSYNANAVGNDEYLECLEACQDDCS